MIELLTANFIYVFYRVAVSANIVKIVNKYFNYYIAVLIMAQFSFAYDYLVFINYFSNDANYTLLELIKSDISYTVRVLVTWWGIKKLWEYIGNYWVAVLIGAQITFICDYFIFADLFAN